LLDVAQKGSIALFEVLKNSKVLVAGGTGFVGVNLICRLLELGADVRATLHHKPAVVQDERIEYVHCDLTRSEDCRRAVEGAEYVFMCAANTSGAAVMDKTPLAHVTPNVVMNTLMLDAAYGAGVRKFLFISSNTVYPAVDHPVTEDETTPGDLFEKYFCVGWMKQFTEVLCRMYAEKIRRPMQTVVVRPANIYGPDDDFEWETSHVLPALIRKAVERHNPIEVWGDGRDVKDFIFIDDFIEGMLLAMEKIETFEPINIATGVPCSIRQALEAILKATDYTNVEIVFNNSRPTMIPTRLIDVTRAKEFLGFEARTPLAEGIERTVDWYKQTHTVAGRKVGCTSGM
jgi:GDP-L-fucose synthase